MLAPSRLKPGWPCSSNLPRRQPVDADSVSQCHPGGTLDSTQARFPGSLGCHGASQFGSNKREGNRRVVREGDFEGVRQGIEMERGVSKSYDYIKY